MAICLEDQILDEMAQGLLKEPVLSLSLIHIEKCEICQSKFLSKLPEQSFRFFERPVIQIENSLAVPRNVIELRQSDESQQSSKHELLQRDSWFGPFRINRLIHEGIATEVYEATDVRLKRQIAIKTLKGNIVVLEPALGSQFMDEARMVAQISHPNVVTIFDVGIQNDQPYIIMPMLEGESLRNRLARGPISSDETLALMKCLIDGLKSAHQIGIIHKDLKPENLWLKPLRGGGHTLIILDFGIAQIMNSPGESVSGTPAYWSPEQVLHRILDERTDFFAVGCVLFEMLTGEPAWASDVRDEFRNPLQDHRLDEKAKMVLGRMMTLDPDQRYSTHESIVADLMNLFNQESEDSSRKSQRRWVTIGAGMLVMALIYSAIYQRPSVIDDRQTLHSINVQRLELNTLPKKYLDTKNLIFFPKENALQIQPDGPIATYSGGLIAGVPWNGNRIVLYDLKNQVKPKVLLESDGFEKAWIDRNGTMMAALRDDKVENAIVIRVWRLNNNTNDSEIAPIWQEKISGRMVYDCCWTRLDEDPVLVASTDRSQIRYYRFEKFADTKPKMETIFYGYSIATNLYAQPNGDLVVAAKNRGGLDIFDLRAKNIRYSFRDFETGPPVIAWQENGKGFTAISPDGLALNYNLLKVVEKSEVGYAYLKPEAAYKINSDFQKVVPLNDRLCIILTKGKDRELHLKDMVSPDPISRVAIDAKTIKNVLRVSDSSFAIVSTTGKIILYDIGRKSSN